MKKAIVAYIPVIHRGYLDYLASTGVNLVFSVQASDVLEFPQLARELRALTLGEIKKSLFLYGFEVKPFSSLLEEGIYHLTEIYMPDDDVTRMLAEKYFQGRKIVFGSAFLRWDWTKGTAVGFVRPEADRVIRKGESEYDACSVHMNQLLVEATKSSDWWRQVGAMAIAVDGKCIVSYNKHYPHEHVQYMDGDPRDSFKPGEFIEISTALHGEQSLIAEAARRGISLQGADLYVTTFPCNLCAPWVTVAGFKRVFFTGGYSNLNGQKTLRDHGIELVYVEL